MKNLKTFEKFDVINNDLKQSIKEYLLTEYPSDWWNNEFQSRLSDYIDDDEEVIVSYCDFGSYWGFFNFMVDTNNKNLDGCIVSYKGFHPHMLGSDNYAFVKTKIDERDISS